MTHANRYELELSKAAKTPTFEQTARLGNLALQARNDNFLTQDDKTYWETYIATDSFVLPDNPIAIELRIQIEGIRSRYPQFSTTVAETIGTDTPGLSIGKIVIHTFSSKSQRKDRPKYVCTETDQIISFYDGDTEVLSAPAVKGRKQRKEVAKLEKLWGTQAFTKQNCDRLLYILGEFNPNRAIIGSLSADED